jgi:hypothetical protein
MTLDPRTRDTLNDPALLAARRRHFARLTALYAGEPLDAPFYQWGYRGRPRGEDIDPYVEPERWVAASLDDLAAHAARLTDPRTFRPLVIEFGPYDVHFIDKMFGADVFDLMDQDKPNWQVRPLSTPIGALQPPDLDTDPTWALSRRLAQAFLAADVRVPLLGLPTIASALNIAVNLYGQEILIAMLTEPEAVIHDLAVINDLLCALHRWYLEHVPLEQLQPVIGWARTQPPGYGQLCGCTTHLVSPGQYARFIAPLDEALLRVYPHGGMIHLCGIHTQHLPVWRAMASLRAVQLNDRAADDTALYLAGLRDDQMLYVNAYEQMPVARILEITGGRRTVVVADPDAAV